MDCRHNCYFRYFLSLIGNEGGSRGLMILPPFFLKPSARDLVECYTEISNAVSTPIMIQDAPMLTAVNISAAQMTQMACEGKNVRYVKVEAPTTTVTEVRDAAGDLPPIFGGLNGHFLIEESQRGAMPGSDMTNMFVRVWNL